MGGRVGARVEVASHRRAPTWRRRIAALYQSGAASSPSRRALTWGWAGLGAAIVVGLLRTGGPGALNSTWIEDAKRFLTSAWVDSFPRRVLKPFNGYFHVGPRVLTEIATLFPVRWAAPVLSLLAATMIAVFAVVAYVASRPYLTAWWARLFVAAPVVLVPLGRTQADNDVATLQFPSLYALFWVLLWRPVSRGGRVAAVVLAGYAMASSILAIALAPLVLVRLFAVRDWTTRLVALAYGAGAALQFGGLAFGITHREGTGSRFNPLWAISEYVTKAVPRSLFGEVWLGGPGVNAGGNPRPLHIDNPAVDVGLIVLAWAIVAAAVALAAFGLTNPHWPLAVLAAGASLAIFAVEVMNMGYTQPRYVIAPALLLYVALAALLRPRVRRTAPGRPAPGRTWPIGAIAMAVLSVVLAVAVVANFRAANTRSSSQGWDETVRQARAACATGGSPTYRYKHTWWYVIIPCDQLS